jgi:hypothetical protein
VQKILYRLFRLTKVVIGTSPVKRVLVKSRALISPPGAAVDSNAGSFRLAFGSGCWSRGDRSACWDRPPPSSARADIPDVQVQPGEVVTFKLAFIPVDVEVVLERRSWQDREKLAPSRTPAWRTPSDLSAPTYIILATRSVPSLAGSGSLSYVARLVPRG